MEQNSLLERLIRIEAGIDGINTRLDRVNGSLGKHDERLVRVEGKCAAYDALAVAGRLKDDSDEDRHSALYNICAGCGPDWREKISEEIRTLEGDVHEKKGEMRGKQVALLIIVQVVSTFGAVIAIFAAIQKLVVK